MNYCEVRELAKQSEFLHVSIKTNFGYTHYLASDGWFGLVKAIGWQEYHYGGKTRRTG